MVSGGSHRLSGRLSRPRRCSAVRRPRGTIVERAGVTHSLKLSLLTTTRWSLVVRLGRFRLSCCFMAISITGREFRRPTLAPGVCQSHGKVTASAINETLTLNLLSCRLASKARVSVPHRWIGLLCFRLTQCSCWLVGCLAGFALFGGLWQIEGTIQWKL